jgi:hypothetical protein
MRHRHRETLRLAVSRLRPLADLLSRSDPFRDGFPSLCPQFVLGEFFPANEHFFSGTKTLYSYVAGIDSGKLPPNLSPGWQTFSSLRNQD